MIARRNVPAQTTRDLHLICLPDNVVMPVTLFGSPATSKPVMESSMMLKFACSRTLFNASSEYQTLSFWQRGDQTAGPLDLFRTLNWIPVASAILPISPPRASISRTRCPLAVPPMAGLQDILPMAAADMVRRSVRHPILAEARDASTPACPPPRTMTS